MRAYVLHNFGSDEPPRLEDLKTPTPLADQVLLKTGAFGLNYPDLLMLQGKYQDRYPTPFTPGRDAAGIVEATGPESSAFKVGDRVMCQIPYGAWADRVLAPASRCFKMPPSSTFTDAAAMVTPFNTAYVAIMSRSRVLPGEIAVVTGASGGVGTALIQLLKAKGIFVVGVVSSPAKRQYIKEIGADEVVAAEGQDLKRTLPDQIASATGGRKADVVFDTVGGDIFDAGLRTLGSDGRMIVVGFASGKLPEVRANYLLLKNISVIGSPLDIHFKNNPGLIAEGVEFVSDLYQRNKLRPTVKAVMPFAALGQALKAAADSSVPGRVVVQID